MEAAVDSDVIVDLDDTIGPDAAADSDNLKTVYLDAAVGSEPPGPGRRHTPPTNEDRSVHLVTLVRFLPSDSKRPSEDTLKQPLLPAEFACS